MLTFGVLYDMIAHVSDFDRKFSSAGRALALQARGHRFEPCNFHSMAR